MSIRFSKVAKSELPHDSELVYAEVQRFNQWWIYALLAIVVIIEIVAMGNALVQQLVYDKPWGTKPMSDAELIISAIFALIALSFAIGLILACHLDLRIYIDGIYFRYFPFHWAYRKVIWNELDSIICKTYKPLIEYGGWGIRWNFKSWAYTVRGNECIELRQGSAKVILGTCQLHNVRSALQSLAERFSIPLESVSD